MRGCFVLMVVLLPACAGITNVKSRESVIGKSVVEADSFKKTSWLKGPMMKANFFKEGMKRDKAERQVDMYCLRAMKDEKTVIGSNFIRIYASNEDTSWNFFESAIDSDGNELEFVKISGESSMNTKFGVGTIEDFAITVDEEYLTSKNDSGIIIRVYGQRGNRTISIPPYYIQGFLERYKSFAAMQN